MSEGVNRMIKKFCALFFALVLLLAMGGCSDIRQPSPDHTEMQPSASVKSSTAPFFYTESNLGSFYISIATDEVLSKYKSYHEYTNDKDGEKLFIRTNTKVKEFAFISIKVDGMKNKLSYNAGDTLFSADELSPEKPFVVKLLIPGSSPAYGISFVDANGATRYYIINLSGRGAEEEPPYFFLEFQNGGSLLSATPLSIS